MVSDGMSTGVIPLAEALSQQVRKRPTQWWQLMQNSAAHHGFIDTASANSLVTDSAAASSAWSSGQRINNGVINHDPNGKSLEPIGVTIKKNGGKLGLVTTATVTHATPAGFAANSPQRSDEAGIAEQYIDRADIILGGGINFFDKTQRRDGKDLLGEFADQRYAVLSHRSQLMASKEQRLLGLFSQGHLPYTLDQNQDPKLQKSVPTLAEMSAAAIQRLLVDDAPFLLQIEGARIDHAAHSNDIAGILWDQLAFDDALATTLELTQNRDDILIVVTSDHGNANPGLNGIGAGYARSSQHFANTANARISFDKLLQKLKQNQPSKANTIKEINQQLGFKPSQAEAEALLDSLAGKEIAEINHQHNQPVGVLGQITANHYGVAFTGTSHTADPTILTSIGPSANQFSGLIRNDSVRERILGLLFS